MALETFTFPASYQSALAWNPRTKIARFGDGYEQRSPDGINPNPRTYNYKWDGPRASITAAKDFLVRHYSVPFLYTPYGSILGQWVCDGENNPSITEQGYGYAIIEATFREIYGF